MAMNVAVGVVAFAGGVLAWAAIGGDTSPSSSNGRDQVAATNDPTAFTIPFGELPAPSEASRPSVPASDGGAPTAMEAIDGFLSAEVSGRFDESFLLLSTTDRDTYRSAARWTQSHSTLPPITGYEITSTEQSLGADRVQITASLTLEPALDEVVGLVPARAEATWISVARGKPLAALPGRERSGRVLAQRDRSSGPGPGVGREPPGLRRRRAGRGRMVRRPVRNLVAGR